LSSYFSFQNVTLDASSALFPCGFLILKKEAEKKNKISGRRRDECLCPVQHC
jgi:hypothetical protein